MKNATIGAALQQLSEHDEVYSMDMDSLQKYKIVDCIYTYDEFERKRKVKFMIKKAYK